MPDTPDIEGRIRGTRYVEYRNGEWVRKDARPAGPPNRRLAAVGGLLLLAAYVAGIALLLLAAATLR